MTDLFRTSVEEVFSRQFDLQPVETSDCTMMKGYRAEIPFSEGNEEYVAHVWADEAILRRLADILLFDDNPEPETLEDLSAELANFIVGHAKMVASDRDLPYTMGTPVFRGIETMEAAAAEHTLVYGIDGHCIAVVIKERRG